MTNLKDRRYKLTSYDISNKMQANLRWLSDNEPLLFEELLAFLEDMTEGESLLVNSQLSAANMTPARSLPVTEIRAYYRTILEMSSFIVSLAEEGFTGAKKNRASFLFTAARVCCGGKVDTPLFKAALLASWIMQEKITFPRTLTPRYLDDVAYIDSRFDEVFAERYEFRGRHTIDKTTIEAHLRHDGPLRSGSL